jgi:hypothetical protein
MITYSAYFMALSSQAFHEIRYVFFKTVLQRWSFMEPSGNVCLETNSTVYFIKKNAKR